MIPAEKTVSIWQIFKYSLPFLRVQAPSVQVINLFREFQWLKEGLPKIWKIFRVDPLGMDFFAIMT